MGENGLNLTVYIIDGYTKLIYHRGQMNTAYNCGYYMETSVDVKHKIFAIYDDSEKDFIFKIENNYGSIDLSEIDYKGYFKNIGKDIPSDSEYKNVLIPLYELFIGKTYEHDRCKINSGDVVFDIGANIGVFTYHALYSGCKKCYVFEPVYKLTDLIEKRLQDVVYTGQVVIETAAISSQDGIDEEFYISEGGITSCLVKNNDSIFYDEKIGLYRRLTVPNNDFYNKVYVRTINIMNYIKQNNIGKIDMLKCDCEGGEYDMIDSLDNDYLSNNIEKMIIEYHYHWKDKSRYHKMLDKLTQCGFQYTNNRGEEFENFDDGIVFLWKKTKFGENRFHVYYDDKNRINISTYMKNLDAKVSIFVGDELVQSTKTFFNFNEFWYNTGRNMNNLDNIRVEIKDQKDNIIYKSFLNTQEKYYGEFETDRYIRNNFFPDLSYKGIMVEVGAGPPEFYSMSKHFRDNGWRCICVDPNPKFVQEHKQLNNEIYEIACSFEEKESTFKIALPNWIEKIENEWDKNQGISFSALDIKYPLDNDFRIEEIPVKVKKLDSLLEELNIEKIDFLSVDTEGWEIEVMKGFDVDKYQPKVILLENVLHLKSYEEYMSERGYELEYIIRYNYIFIKKN
jgi:FkbM family methyltransferase